MKTLVLLAVSAAVLAGCGARDAANNSAAPVNQAAPADPANGAAAPPAPIPTPTPTPSVSSAESPADVVQEFIRRGQAGECAGIAVYLRENLRPMAPMIEQQCEADARTPRERPSIRVVDTIIEGSTAYVTVDRDRTSGPRSQTLILVREADGWKIDILASQQAGGTAPRPAPPLPAPR